MQTDTVLPEAVISSVIVFGRDDKGKPHASRFEAGEAPLAERAAGLMGMQVLRIASEEAVTLAATLPAGRIFASGRGFVPFVKAELFAKLEAAPGAFTPARPPEAPTKAPGRPKGGRSAIAATNPVGEDPEADDGPASPPADWGSIEAGHTVLAADEGEPTWWYVANVVSQRGPDLFELRWNDWPELPLIVRRREHLALLPPGFKLDAA